jgi:hypothetical protein
MSRLQTMARFEDPSEPAAIDLTGRTAWVYLSELAILDGLCTCADLRVEVTGDVVGARPTDKHIWCGNVQWNVGVNRWRTLEPYVTVEAAIIRAALAAVTPERAIEALMEAE